MNFKEIQQRAYMTALIEEVESCYDDIAKSIQNQIGSFTVKNAREDIRGIEALTMKMSKIIDEIERISQ